LDISALVSAFIEFVRQPAVGGVIVGLNALMVADFATAVAASFRTKGPGIFGSNFEPLFVAEFLRSHTLGRLLPIVVLILLTSIAEALVAVVALGVAAYTVETMASIKSNLSLPRDAA
jgi:hypothetical protein